MALPISIFNALKVCVGAHFRRQCLAAAVGGGAYSDVDVCATFLQLHASPGAVLEDDESVSAGQDVGVADGAGASLDAIHLRQVVARLALGQGHVEPEALSLWGR